MYPTVSHIGVRLEGAVLRITLDKPETRNALDDVMLDCLVDILEMAANDDDVRVIVLRGANGQFCSGADIVARNQPTDRKPRVGSIQRRVPLQANRLVKLLLEIQVPVVCVVEGNAVGLGFHLALAADFTVATTDASFREPFLSRGFTPDSGATWLLPRLVGVAGARQILMLGEALTGADAAERGLIHAAAGPDDLEAVSEALVTTMAAAPTVALGLTKWLLNTGGNQSFDQQTANEAFTLELSSRSPDFREGMAAFREKRPPSFEGR